MWWSSPSQTSYGVYNPTTPMQGSRYSGAFNMSGPQSNNYIPGYQHTAGTMNLNGYPMANGMQPGYTGGMGFSFKKRVERIDWRKIASVDADQVSRSMDVETLQDNMMNITFCNIESELDSRTMDPNYIKLFKLSQLIIEYLLHSQNYLFTSLQELGTEFNREKEEHSKTKNDVVGKLQTELSDLKKELHHRKKIIAVQQQLIHSGNESYVKCSVCGKNFFNDIYLRGHMERKHPDVSIPNFQSRQPNEPQITSRELDNELQEIRERLKLTESQLIDERNSRNSLLQQEKAEKEKLEQDFMKQMDAWKAEQLERHKGEMDQVRMMFTKELKEMADKQKTSEEALEELRQMRIPGSMLGMLRDDNDNEDMHRQREEVKQMKDQLKKQLNQVETVVQSRLSEQDKIWKKKMDQMKQRHNEQMDELNRQMEERLRDLEMQRNKQHRSDREEKRQMARQMRNYAERQSRHAENMVQKEPPVKKQKAAPPQQAVKVELSETEEDEMEDNKDIEEEKMEDEEDVSEEEEEEEIADDEERTVGESRKRTKPVQTNIRKRLQAALEKNPNFLKGYLSDVSQQLDIALESHGIAKNSRGLDDKIYTRVSDVLKNERNNTSKRHKNFYDIRNKLAIQVDERARKLVREQQLNNPTTSSRNSHNENRTPRSSRSTLSTSGRPTSDPNSNKRPQIPKAAPRLASPRAASLPPTGQLNSSLKSTGSVSGASQNNYDSDDYDTVDSQKNSKQSNALSSNQRGSLGPEPRPRAKTPTDLGGSKKESSVNQQTSIKHPPEEDEESDWDEDELSDLDDLPSKNKPQASSDVRSTGRVAQKKQALEQQLMKDRSKPFGGVDVMAAKNKSVNNNSSANKKTAVADDDDDDFSLTSVSIGDDEDLAESKPMPKPRQPTVRASLQSSSASTSAWSSGKGAASQMQISQDDANASWDDSDG